jgi:hypothetical protein
MERDTVRRPIATIATGVCALALVLGVAACNGDDDAGPPTGQNGNPDASTPNSVRGPGGTTDNSAQQTDKSPGGTLPEQAPGPVDGGSSTTLGSGGSGGIGTPGG